MRIEINRSISGRFSTIVFGLAQLLDGFVRVLSLGFLHTTIPIEVSKYFVKKRFKQSK